MGLKISLYDGGRCAAFLMSECSNADDFRVVYVADRQMAVLIITVASCVPVIVVVSDYPPFEVSCAGYFISLFMSRETVVATYV